MCKVTLITCIYNGEKCVRSLIQNVNSQDYKEIEHIIIDGNSADSTLKIIKEEKSVHKRLLISEKDDGLYDAINKGLKLASGDLIGVLHCGDVFGNTHIISDVVSDFKKDKSKIISGLSFFFNPKSLKVNRVTYPFRYNKFLMFLGIMPSHTMTFIPKHIYEKVGLYKTDYRIAGDYDFFVRALLIQKFEIKSSQAIFNFMSNGGISTSGLSSVLTISQEMIKILRANGFRINYLVMLRLPIKLIVEVLGMKLIRLFIRNNRRY